MTERFTSSDQEMQKFGTRLYKKQGNRFSFHLPLFYWASLGKAFFLYVSVCYLEVNIKCLCKALTDEVTGTWVHAWIHLYLYHIQGCKEEPLETETWVVHSLSTHLLDRIMLVFFAFTAHECSHFFKITVCVNGQIESVRTVKEVQKWKTRLY